MGLHPPLLYLGYVGLTVPFALAMAALLRGQLGDVAATARRLDVVRVVFCRSGHRCGGWWSYEVLGWGGYWAWDPVENASFLPWLTATAFLHSRDGPGAARMLKAWN